MAEEDQAIADALARVTPEQWAQLTAAVEAVDAEPTYATWAGGEVVDTIVVDGVEKPVTQAPYPVYREAVQRLHTTVGQLGLVVPYDWMGWEGVRLHRGGAGMADAPVADAVRMVTAIIRSERFGDGSIESALADGTFQAALGRLLRWAQAGT
jgi:hypothetical protein